MQAYKQIRINKEYNHQKQIPMITAKFTSKTRVNSRTGEIYRYNLIKAGRKLVAEIWEPCSVTGYKYSVSVKIAPGYALRAKTDSLPDAIEKFDELTDGKYIFA